MQSRALLIGGDVAALAAFGLLGLASHEDGVTLESVARSVLPFVVAWLAVAPWTGAFGERAVDGRLPVAMVAMTWAGAGVAGMIGRAIVFDRELITAFLAIGLVGMGLLLCGWRAVYNWWATRTSGSPQEVPTLGR